MPGVLKVYHYPKCSTCRKALTWLKSHGVPHQLIDITLSPPSAAELRKAVKQSGLPLAKWFNTSGQAYREGDFKERLKTMSETETLQALAANGKLIKRPLLIGQDTVLVGFSEAEYNKQLAT